MPSVTPAYVKNIIRRGFSQLVDPAPDVIAVAAIWAYFDSKCAYCRNPLSKSKKEGHIDHLISASSAGSNGLGNRVLACAPCNEKEKRELPWEQFLRTKAKSDADFTERSNRIRQWQQMHMTMPSEQEARLSNSAMLYAEEVIVLFETKVAELRLKMRDSNTTG